MLSQLNCFLQIKRITKLHSGGPRIAELNGLLDKEVQLLNGIERQRAEIRSHLAEVRAENTLNQMGEPIKWIGYRSTYWKNFFVTI